ncbi:hypothetical protein BWD42_07590 [Sphingobacterium sp. CZ-UAM]|uniref:hypothetical protein n=1 Tax=Sphingobacterium sp. CZ-UAM TaxID=1933868 RepID=UPI0009C50C81|nr:hypothetical protein [Sphingobacterium sp. CZ-UAM]OOG19755.1 hypothetical protein BWD42_07590 [Sphingobacterium sp. CZ-UAM]
MATVTCGICQDKAKDTVLITGFVKAVFGSKTKSAVLAKKYIILPPVLNSRYSDAERLKIFDRHVQKIRKEKMTTVDTADMQVVAYREYCGEKVNFPASAQHEIYILISKQKPRCYFLVMAGKIRAFDYIEKGGGGLFITY